MTDVEEVEFESEENVLERDASTDLEETDGDDVEDAYMPVFSASERKIAYLVSGLVGILGGVLSIVGMVTGMPELVTVLGSVCSMVGAAVASMFGVRYVGVGV